MEVLVSIIIPVYNMEKHISDCLESVINQTLENIEVLCIDDCSIDNSKNNILFYSKKDKRVKYFKLENNSGSGIARNFGISIAEGEFLAFMDPDDFYYDKYALEHLYVLAKQNKVNAVAGNIVKYNHKTREEKPFPMMYFSESKMMNLEEYLFYGAYSRFLFKTKMIKDNNIIFPPYRRRQDPVFLYKAMVQMGEFYTTTQNVYMYRISHKTVPWNSIQIIDALKSYVENIKLLVKYELYQHYRIEINDFKEKFLMNKTLKINKNIEFKYKEICESIKYEYLKKSIPLCLSSNEKVSVDKFMKNNILKKDISYIIYGFGNLGNALYEKMKKEYNILGIVDKFFNGLDVDSLKVVSTIELLNYSNSKIIVTILNHSVKHEIISSLEKDYNIDKNDIFSC